MINLDGVPLDGSSRRRMPAVVDAEYQALRQKFDRHITDCDVCPSLPEIHAIADAYVQTGHGDDDASALLVEKLCPEGAAMAMGFGKLSWERGDRWGKRKR